MSTLQPVELGVLGPLQVRRDGAPVMIPGGKPRAILTMLGLHGGSVVPAEALIELLWGDDPPRTAAKALQTHISSLRRTLGDGFVLTAGTGWTLAESGVDASRYKSAARLGRDAAAAGDTSQAVSRFEEALALWRGIPELPDGRRGTSEKTRWIEGHAALVEDRADALLVTGRAAEIIGELEAAVAEAPLRERRWGQLMLALYRAGRQGDALGAYKRARALLADELGVDPGPDLRRLEIAIVAQDTALEIPAAQDLRSVTRTVTFLLTDIEGSTAAWEADADAMAVALARHDELVEQVVTSRGGRLIKTRGEGDATFSVFDRASAAAAAAIELQDAIFHEPWGLQDPMSIRVALHTGEVELRDGDYFGRAVNRAARLRSLAIGGQILCSGAVAELVVDSLPDDVVLADLGMRQLRNLARPEHVFELRLETAASPQKLNDAPIERPGLPAVLTGPGPFVGRGRELEGLVSAWQTALAGGTHAVLIAGEPGVGKTRLAGEWSQKAYGLEAIVLYGRCDEDLGVPYQPFAEALRSLVPCVGTSRLRGIRGVEALLTLVPGLTDVLPDLAAPTRADPETERYALFDAVVALLELASADAPVVLILDDLHWAAKPTLLLLRHLLRFGDRARVQIVGTYRSTDLDRSHPLAAMLADLHRGAGSGTANRLALSGLDEDDVTAYVTEAGYNDDELARALASVTGGNPFFLIEALRHVDETGGVWDPTTLPQGVRETVSRRLSRLTAETNTALAAAAVVGSRFALDLVEKVVDQDLVDAFDEACKAGIVIEEPGGRYRFNHAIVRQSLLAELPSVRRQRLHQRIAMTLETQPGADDELLAELAHHYFECAWAGNAAKAVEYCRRAADQAVARLAYEGAADLYGQALHALEEIDDELPDRDDQAGELLVARCEALLAAGDVTLAAGAVSQLQASTVNSARLAAWATCFDGELSMLIHPERLDEVEAALGLAAQKLAEIDDAAGEAKAHTVRAACLARLGRIGDGEIALDDALTAARRARDHRRVNAVLAGAPLAALWGPNPVPRAGGRCLDVVRLLRITTDSPAVEATSTRCQAVLEAFRGRAEAARRMIDSARRTVTELGLRHALLEVEQFAGIVELIVDDPTAAEPHFRQAYNGFRRMGLDADTAETAALLGRTCLALERDTEADELCLESERLAGHALKASIAWRTLRARLLSRGHEHGEARRIAEAAVALAERTDALVDHGDSCLTLATVLGAAGDAAGARTAAERAVDLYERKGAAALAERARRILGEPNLPSVPVPPELPQVAELDNACIRVGKRMAAAMNREAWDEFEQLYAPEVFSESHRTVIGYAAGAIVAPENWAHEIRRVLGASGVRLTAHDIAVRGERLALARFVVGTADASPGAPQDEFLQIYGIDEEGRISVQIIFDLDDLDPAIAELDATHARFEDEARRRARRLENAASQAAERHSAHFAARDWDALAKVLAEDFVTDDRRRAVNAGIRHGRDAEIANMRAAAEVGITYTAFVIIAVRGERLILTRASVGGGGSAEFTTEVLSVVEINPHNQIAAFVIFELDDFDSAITELDARYLAGEAAAHARTWSVVTGTFASVSRQELPANTPDCVTIDHRRVTAFAPGEMTAYIRAGWEIDQTIRTYAEVVHRLSDLGAVCTYAAHGVSREGFDGEWRGVSLGTVSGAMLNRCELFDDADLDAALARFDQLSRPAPRLDNAASQVSDRYMAHFAARNWDGLATVLADDICVDDRRRVANAGIRRGRDAEIANLQAAADVGITYLTDVVIAARGKRLILMRTSGDEGGSGEFVNDVLGVVEINSHNQIAAIVVFDPDDFDAAVAELDARYLSGEAAAHAHTWSVVTGSYAALNRHELPSTTTDWVNLDHRRGTSFASGEMPALINAAWNLTTELRHSVEAVHRLNDLGAVVTNTSRETSQDGFDAEWRVITVATVEGDKLSRCEVFDEADLDAALAVFDKLSRSTPRPENSATRVFERLFSHIAARDWDAWAQTTAENVSLDDRRRVVNAGIRHGRDASIIDTQATVDVGFAMTMVGSLATRGERLALIRVRVSGRDPGAIRNDALNIVEIDADDRIVAGVVFDLEDFDAAIAELDARYLAGEAAAHTRTWAVIAGVLVAHNRREVAATTADVVSIDHRRVAGFAPGEGFEYIRAGWDLGQNLNIYTETAHRLNDLGAVFTWAGHGTSHEGFVAEWRGVTLMTVDGEMVSRMEVFDEGDLDAALAKFEELSRPTPRLENAASQAYERFRRYFADRDWAAMAELLTVDTSVDDHRRVVNAEIRRGRDVEIANMRAFADIGAKKSTATVIAIRGEHLVLCRSCISGEDEQPGGFRIEMLNIIEITAEKRILARVAYDPDDIDAAIGELDARYLAGEAAPYRDAWSVIAAGYAALNRHEVPPSVPNYVNIDHRLRATFEAADLGENLRAALDLTPELEGCIEVVHRLSGLRAVVTHAAHGTTQDGLDAEWREIHFLTLDGGMVNRCEIYDEADLDAVLARFDELQPQAPRLENAVGRILERYQACFSAREWTAMSELLADDIVLDDRRRVVNAGVQRGREVHIADLRAAVEVGAETVSSSVAATRGERLALAHARAFNRGAPPGEVGAEWLVVAEIDADERIVAVVSFDLDGFDAAIAELDARYLAGEAAAYADTWPVIAGVPAGFNRKELPATTPDPVYIDHRPLVSIEGADLAASIRAVWDITSDASVYIEAVHRLSERGAVVTEVLKMTSQAGFDAELWMIMMFTVEGDLICGVEVFDEAELDAALARFEELHPPTPRLENAASRLHERFLEYYAAADSQAMAQMLAETYSSDDRRPVVGSGVRHGRDAHIADMRVRAELWNTNLESSVLAIRGERLALMRIGLSDRHEEPQAFSTEVLAIGEIDADERIVASFTFDLDDVDAAFAELDARYLAGEAAAHAHFWSVITGGYVTLNKHELPPVTSKWVTIDHRLRATFEAADQTAYIRGAWDLTPDLKMYIEAVHRLSNLGAVVTHAAYGSTQEGFDAEWRMIGLLTAGDGNIGRCELFDESDLDAALARFEELQPQPPRLENAATQVVERFWTYFEARDWDAMAETWAEDYCTDDRRRVVNAGVLRGRADHLTNMRAVAEVGFERLTSTVVATRGQRLALIRIRSSVRGSTPGEVSADMPSIVETDPDGRLAAAVHFDTDDINAAFEELDARYLAGEAAVHAHAWSVIARTTAAFNRHELPAADWAIIDHRQLAPIDASDLPAAVRAIWDLTPDLCTRIEAVHRLSNFGAVVTNTAYGTSPEGFAAEWRLVDLVIVEGDRISRDEFFDEADLDAALARFDELERPPRLENAASQLVQRFRTYFAARNWAAVAENSAHEIFTDDRRSVVSSGILHGRDIDVANIRAIADLGATDLTSTVIATRGERLVLTRLRLSGRDQRPEAFHSEMLGIVEIDADNRVAARFLFDLNDIDAAFEELDARYLAGEASDYAQTWSVIARTTAAFNRHELLATDWVTIDHRTLAPIDASDLPAAMRATWDLTPDFSTRIEAVHRVSGFGAAVTYTAYGTSLEGFAAEWRMVDVLTVEGDRISRVEFFDEADLDAALARYDELERRTPSCENAATRIWARAADAFNGRDVDSFLARMTANGQFEDRRKGLRAVHKGAARRKAVRAVFEEAPASWRMHAEPIATRGSRLELTRECYCDTDDADRPIVVELVHVMELGDDDLIRDIVSFDPDDRDDAFAELTARWIASGEVAYPEPIEAVDRINATINRHDWDAAATHFAGAEYVDHRQLAHVVDGTIADWLSSMQTTGSLVPNLWVELAEVLARSAIGIVGRMALKGTSTDGAAIEIPFVVLMLLHGERVTRLEAFDEGQRELALARLQEFNRPV